MEWKFLHPHVTMEHLGYLPEFLSENDPRPAREQINDNYAHGGGWSPFKGFSKDKYNNLSYPGDPEMSPVAETKLRDETILFYPYSWLVIIQPDGSWEVSCVD